MDTFINYPNSALRFHQIHTESVLARYVLYWKKNLHVLLSKNKLCLFVCYYKLIKFINSLSYLLSIGPITILSIINSTLLKIYFRDLIQTDAVRIFSTFPYSQLKKHFVSTIHIASCNISYSRLFCCIFLII